MEQTKTNCYSCGSDRVFPVTVTLDMMGAFLDGMVCCVDCQRVAPSLQETWRMMRKLKAFRTGTCGFCWHYQNTSALSRMCYTTKIYAPNQPNAIFEIDNSSKQACEHFTPDREGPHCQLCASHKPHFHNDVVLAKIQSITDVLESMAAERNLELTEAPPEHECCGECGDGCNGGCSNSSEGDDHACPCQPS